MQEASISSSHFIQLLYSLLMGQSGLKHVGFFFIFFFILNIVGVSHSNGCLTLADLLQCMILHAYHATSCIKHHNLGIK